MKGKTAAKPVVLLGIPGSPFVGQVARCLGAGGVRYLALSIDAPLEGRPVTVSAKGVYWEGADLLAAGVIFVERLVFPWPQVGIPPKESRRVEESKKWVNRRREAMSLAWSAVLAAAEVVPVVNPPPANHLAVSPAVALDRLAGSGVRVHPWRLEPARSAVSAGPSTGPGAPRSADASALDTIIDASGRDRWHDPGSPRAGESAIVFGPLEGQVVKHLVVGGEVVAGGALDPEAAQLAIDAASSLELDFAAVWVCAGARRPAVLLCEAGPDLASWNRALEGRVAPALAGHLAHLASKESA